jgi:hypothetical protein
LPCCTRDNALESMAAIRARVISILNFASASELLSRAAVNSLLKDVQPASTSGLLSHGSQRHALAYWEDSGQHDPHQFGALTRFAEHVMCKGYGTAVALVAIALLAICYLVVSKLYELEARLLLEGDGLATARHYFNCRLSRRKRHREA